MGLIKREKILARLDSTGIRREEETVVPIMLPATRSVQETASAAK